MNNSRNNLYSVSFSELIKVRKWAVKIQEENTLQTQSYSQIAYRDKIKGMMLNEIITTIDEVITNKFFDEKNTFPNQYDDFITN